MRPPKTRVDVAMIAHAKRTWVISGCAETVINVSHGVIPEEAPQTREKTVFTSEEVRSFWKRPGSVIPQPIDMDFWRPADTDRRSLLFYSYRSPDALGLDAVADKLGLEFRFLTNATPDEAREAMQSAAVCFASGRAALESMACDAPTVICDHRDYNGGPLCEIDMDRARFTNYSGRGGVSPSLEMLETAALQAIETQRPREYCAQWHEAGAVTEKLMQAALC